MMRVKICGLRRPEDIEYVNKYTPHYAGFVFAKSRRQVTMEQGRELRDLLNPSIKAAGVFVNETADRVAQIAVFCRLDIIQLHGDESPEYFRNIKDILNSMSSMEVEIWKAVRVKDEESLIGLNEYPKDAVLLDAYADGSYGGAGKTFDWNLAVLAKKHGKIILAGGLTLDNVKDAVNMIKPFAVDVSSGVETDGCKDESKIREFIRLARDS